MFALPVLLALSGTVRAGAVFPAMERELARAQTLKREGFAPPYFLAYRLTEHRVGEMSAAWGALTGESREDYRVVYVEARVGDRTLDNADLSFQGWHGSAGDTTASLRQQLWLLSDQAYKNALAGFLEKKAKRATELIVEEFNDFSIEEPSRGEFPDAPFPFDRGRLADLLRGASAVFGRHPHVYDAHAVARVHWIRRSLLSSEGSRLRSEGAHVPGVLRIGAMTRAADGMRIDNLASLSFRSLSELPSRAELERRSEELAAELDALREAPVQAPAAAPAILDPEFTGVLFHEALGHKLEGQRQRDPNQSQVFKDLVGKRIIPDFISLHDDPTLESFAGRPLNGHYRFDAEGVRARRVSLVERGMLKSFLMSRWPIKGFEDSNGHGRSDAYRRPTGRMATLIVEASGALPRARLESRLLELVRASGKPYGFHLVGSFGGENPNVRGSAQTLEVLPRLVYRVDARTGKRALVRGVKLVGTPLAVLNRIVAAGDDPALANEFLCGAESGRVPVSQIAPSVLVSEIELQRLPEDRSVVPVLGSPWGGGKR